MNELQILLTALSIALSQSVSFKVAGKYLVTVVAPPGAAPNHLTFTQAISAIRAVLTQGTGSVTVGDVQLSVTAL